MSFILLQRFANREYRLAHQNISVRKPSGKDKYKEVQNERYANAVNDSYVLSQELKQGESASISNGHLRRSQFGEVDARLGIRALDIIDEFQTKLEPAKKGGWGHLSKPTTFGRNARHRLLEAGAIVDKVCGLNAWEITCTLPGGTTGAIRTLAENTGWLMNELTQIIRRAKCKYWFYVWEFQKRGALHLHLLIADPEKNLQSLAQKLESRWWQTLEFLSKKNQVDLFARRHGGSWKGVPSRWQSHIAPIQKSVAAYFSKYASKGLKPSSATSYQKKLFSPSRWWGCSTEIKAQIKIHRQKWKLEVSPSTAKKIEIYLQSWLNDPGRIKAYSYEFQLGKTANGTELGGGEVWINYYNDAAFARMQSWEKIAWDGALAIAHSVGEYEYPTDSWSNEDKACPTPLADGIAKYKNNLRDVEVSTVIPHLPPLTRHLSLASKLSKSRVSSSVASLDLRALAVQYLAGGAGESSPEDLNYQPCQLELGLTNLLTPYYHSNVVNRLNQW